MVPNQVKLAYVTSAKPQSHFRLWILPSIAPDSRDASLPARTLHLALEHQVPMFSGQTTLGRTLGVEAGTEHEFLRAFQSNGVGALFLDLSVTSDKPLMYEGGGWPWQWGQPEESSRSLQVRALNQTSPAVSRRSEKGKRQQNRRGLSPHASRCTTCCGAARCLAWRD